MLNIIDIILNSIFIMLIINKEFIIEILLYFIIILFIVSYMLPIWYISLIYCLIFISGLFLLYILSFMISLKKELYSLNQNRLFYLVLILILILNLLTLPSLFINNIPLIYNVLFIINEFLYSYSNVIFLIGMVIIISFFILKELFT